MARKQLYVSLDIEADGTVPGPFSMLSFGMVIIDLEGKIYGTYTANLEKLEYADPLGHPDTMKWWNSTPSNKVAYEKTRDNLVLPKIAMIDCKGWLSKIAHDNTAVLSLTGFPICYDFMWLYWYMMNITGTCKPLTFNGFDIKTAAAIALDLPYSWANKRNFPKRFFKGAPKHTHIALDDAMQQAILFVNIMKELKDGKVFDEQGDDYFGE